MDFKLTEEQELLLESVDDLMEQFGTEAYFKQGGCRIRSCP